MEHGQDHPYAFHVFVCTKGPECPNDGPADDIRNALKKRVKEAGRKDEIRVNNAGCLGQCGHGPMMVTYPDGVWYSHLKTEDALEILDHHILGNKGPVERLRYRLGPGGCKAARSPDGLTLCDGEDCRV